VTASPTTYTIGDRLKTINTTLGSPFQAGGNIGNTSFASTIADGANVTQGAKADAKSAATDTTAITAMQVAKEISFANQNPITTSATNPTSTLTLTSATTAYTAGQLIASNASAGSVVVPSFAIANSAGAAAISRVRLTTNDATGTAWGAQTIQVDLWSAAPTFTNGDRGAWAVATGSAGHLGMFYCIVSAEQGDGAWAECAPTVGNAVLVKLGSGTAIYWTLNALTGSGVTGASKVFTLTAEITN
jgi:hypothetical protein